MKTFRLEEACNLCGVEKEIVIHFIEEDWIHPLNQESFDLDDEDIARLRLIRELKEDFGVNDEGMPIILQLVDQLNRLHLEIMKLHQGDIL